MKKVGQCLHLISDFICSEGKYQNYPCPYCDMSKCPNAIIVTEEMAKQWETKGFIHVAR